MVRQGRLEDTPVVLSIFDERNNQGQDYPPLRVDDLEVYCQTDHILYYVAEENNSILGFMVAYDMGSWCYIDIIVVKREARGRGIGKELIKALSGNWRHVDCCVTEYDTETVIWLGKQGFKGQDRMIWKSKWLN